MNKLASPRLILIAVGLALACLFSPHPASAQTCGLGQSPPIEGLGFPRGSKVQVYIDPEIKDERRNSVVQAFNDWEAAGFSNGSNITYEFVSQPLPPNTGITVNNQAPLSGDRAHTDAYVNDTNGYTMFANIQITPGMWKPEAVLEAMVHEIGHVYGLGHCNCSTTQSVMSTPGYSDPNQVVGRPTSPTACDNQAVTYIYLPCDGAEQNACYYSGGIWNEAACSCNTQYGGGGGGGDAGGGYYGYCTPYYWVYYESWDGGKTWQIVDVSYAGCW